MSLSRPLGRIFGMLNYIPRLTLVTMLYVLVIAGSGCATDVRLPLTEHAGKIPNDTGVVIVSTGGRWLSSFGHYIVVEYEVAQEVAPGSFKKVDFIPAELINAGNMSGDLGKENYGYVHVFELPAGTYYLIGTNLGPERLGDLVPVKEAADKTIDGILLSVTILGGRVNYLGEIVASAKPLLNENVQISDMWTRDRQTAVKLKSEIARYPFIYNPPDKMSRISESGL